MGDVKDLDPDVVQGVLNFIDTNTQLPETLEVLEDVKVGMGVGPSDTGTENVPDKLGSLRLLNKVSFGIRDQCKLITDLSYQMDDVTCGKGILGQLMELYRSMYNTCRKDSVILPLRKDHLKFRVLCGQRRKKGVFRGRRIAPLYPNRTVKSHQVKMSRFGRKSNSQVTEMTITDMLAGKDGNDNDNETPMEVSENEDDVVPFMDLASYKGQDQMWEKVLTTPGLLQWKYSTFQVNIFLYAVTICSIFVTCFYFLI